MNGKFVKKDNDSSTALVAYCTKYQKSSTLDARYEISGEAGNLNSMHFTILTNNLQETSYRIDSTTIKQVYEYFARSDFENEPCKILFQNDYINVKITSITNNRISGTFSGKMTKIPTMDYSTQRNVVISEGKFVNLPILQQ